MHCGGGCGRVAPASALGMLVVGELRAVTGARRAAAAQLRLLSCVGRGRVSRPGLGLLRPKSSLAAGTASACGPAEGAAQDTAQGATGVLSTTCKAATQAVTWRDQAALYAELSKARLSALVVFTSSAGFLMAGSPVSLSGLAAVTVGTSLAAASASTWNQVWERELDAKMRRTARRPLPAGHIATRHAVAWGVATGVASAGVLLAGTNVLTAALGVGNIALYALAYTPMKVRSVWNTWVGAVVGAIPPVMGWTAATGTLLTPEAALLGGTLFLWQFPHFFSLAWRCRADYAAAGYQMLPVVDPSGVSTARVIQRYVAYMGLLPLATTALGATTVMFAVESALLTGYWYMLARRFSQRTSSTNAQRVFRVSLWYLPLSVALMVFHSTHWADQDRSAPSHAAAEAAEAAEAAATAGVVLGAEEATGAAFTGADAATAATVTAAAATPPPPPPHARAPELSVVDDLVSKMREELSGLCPHELLRHKDVACPAPVPTVRPRPKLASAPAADAPAASAAGTAAEFAQEDGVVVK